MDDNPTSNSSENLRQPQDAAKVAFEDLGLSEPVLTALRAMGFRHPTDVQIEAIPPATNGRDLMVQARTGSGKTAAFGVPLCEGLIQIDQPSVQALILAPTRELALQVANECARIAANTPIKTTAIYGGAAMGPQIRALQEGAQIVGGTPGRVLDHIRRGNLKTDAIRVLVLDEADEMLSMGFLEEINAILAALPDDRQTMLFSATIPPEIERMIAHVLRDPLRLQLSEDFVGVHEIDHAYYLITGGNRTADLLKVLKFEDPELALIFCNTREQTGRVASFLSKEGFAAEAISSDLSQPERERVMKRMREGELRYLVATDIAARGIDIADLSHVINFQFPESPDVYVHRTGRTGRAGKSGRAVSLVSPKEIGSFYYLRLIHKIFPEERHLPTPEEATSRREGELYEQLQQHYADKPSDASLESLVRRVWSASDGITLLAHALGEVLGEAKREPRRPKARKPTEAPSRRRTRETSRDADRDRERPRSSSGRRERSRRGERDSERASRGPARGERKTTRSRSRQKAARSPEQGAFTTADGEIEMYEELDVSRPGTTGGASAAPPAEPEPPRGQPSAVEDGQPEANAETSEPDMARLYVNVGRRHNVRTEDLTNFFQIEGELQAEQIGRVQQRDRHTYINVAAQAADEVIQRLSGKLFNERELRVEHARSKSR